MCLKEKVRKKIPDLKKYLKELKSVREMFVWIWRELINHEGKKLAKKMVVTIITGFAFQVTKPWFIGLVLGGLAARDERTVIYGLLGFCVVMFTAQMIQRRGLKYRELLFGENIRQLDRRTTELFFEKSLGTHMDESNLLNEANIKKGYERVFQLMGLLLFEGVESVLGLVFPYMALWLLDRRIALIVSVMLVCHFAWTFYLNRKVLEVTIPIDKKWRSLNRFRVERLDQIERVKTQDKESDEVEELGKRFEDAIVPDRKFWLWFLRRISDRNICDYFALAGIMAIGSYLVWEGNMSVGILFPLFSWSNQLADNLWRIGHLEHQINFITPSVLSMKEALSLPIGVYVPSSPIPLSENAECGISFKNIVYAYSEKSGCKKAYKVLDGISFDVKPGEKVAILGSSGAGKTTIMRLLLRFMDPTSGSIKIDGIDLKEIDTGSWLKMVGYVPQNAQILDGSIRYNLLYSLSPEEQKRVTDDQLYQLMKMLRIDFGDRLFEGLDTVVGRKGVKLSGGQAQRIMIGAAVMKDPKFMIIDEATSSLDPTTEKQVQEGLEKVLKGKRGALIITHRLNTVRRICDKFVMLGGNGGGSRVTAIANSFESLALQSMEFQRLARDQSIIL